MYGISIKVNSNGFQQGIIYMYLFIDICFHCQGARPKNCSKKDPKDPGAVLQDRGRVSHQTVDRDPGSRHGQTVGPDQPRNRSVQYYTVCLSVHQSVYPSILFFFLLILGQQILLLLKILEIKKKTVFYSSMYHIYHLSVCLSDSIMFVRGRQNSIAARILKF